MHKNEPSAARSVSLIGAGNRGKHGSRSALMCQTQADQVDGCLRDRIVTNLSAGILPYPRALTRTARSALIPVSGIAPAPCGDPAHICPGRPVTGVSDVGPGLTREYGARLFRPHVSPGTGAAGLEESEARRRWPKPVCTAGSPTGGSRSATYSRRRSAANAGRCSPPTTTPPPGCSTRPASRSCSSATRPPTSSTATTPPCRSRSTNSSPSCAASCAAPRARWSSPTCPSAPTSPRRSRRWRPPPAS